MRYFVVSAFLAALAALADSRVEAYTNCGVTSSTNFKSWTTSFDTDTPVVYPTSDAEINAYVSTAKSKGCKVRVVGTAHSFNGIVHHKTERNVLVLSMASYVPPTAWNGVLDTVNARVRMGAGRTFLDLYQLIRPQGYLLPTQTAGLFFSLGGVFMNPSVHGSNMNSDRLAKLVTGLTAVLSDGTSVTITAPAELAKWRGSMGLLGIVTAIEIQLRRDTGLAMSYDEFNSVWTQANVNAFLTNSAKGKDTAEWFYNPYNDQIQAMTMNFTAAPGFNYASTASYYATLQSQNPTLATTGSVVSEANNFFATVNSWTGTLLDLGQLLMAIGFSQQKSGWLNNAVNVRDGYFIDPRGIVQFDNAQTFVKCAGDCITDNTIWSLLGQTRTLLKNIISTPGAPWYPTLPVEFRIVNVGASGDMLLEHLAPGRWVSFEIVNMKDRARELDEQAPTFAQLEFLWNQVGSVGAAAHHGKEWGYGSVGSLPRPYAFQDATKSNRFYSSATRSSFIAAMNAYDVSQTFRAGDALRLLGLSTIRYEPRVYGWENSQGSQTDCDTFGASDCLTGCCFNNIFTILDSHYQKCTDARIPRWKGFCWLSCQCVSGASCVAGLCI